MLQITNPFSHQTDYKPVGNLHMPLNNLLLGPCFSIFIRDINVLSVYLS